MALAPTASAVGCTDMIPSQHENSATKHLMPTAQIQKTHCKTATDNKIQMLHAHNE